MQEKHTNRMKFQNFNISLNILHVDEDARSIAKALQHTNLIDGNVITGHLGTGGLHSWLLHFFPAITRC